MAGLLGLLSALGAAGAPPGVIGTRQTDAGWEFFDRSSGQSFVPRGVNWEILSGSGAQASNATFSDPAYAQARPRTEAMLDQMKALGYNVVRVRLNAREIAGPDRRQRGLNPRYIDDLADFIGLAARDSIRVELVGDWTPGNYYASVMREDYPRPQPGAEGINMVLMSPGLAAAQGEYLADVLTQIRRRSPDLLASVFAVDIWNELCFDAAQKPFSADQGRFTLRMNRRTYALNDAFSRQALADDALRRWMPIALAPIRAAAPGVLLTASSFPPRDVKRDGYAGVSEEDSASFDPREPLRLTVLEETPLDFLEIHVSPRDIDGSVDGDLQSMEWSRLRRSKPILIGGFGAPRADFGSPAAAAAGLGSFLDDMRRRGMAGWLYWSWDTADSTGESPWWGLCDGGGYLSRALAPAQAAW